MTTSAFAMQTISRLRVRVDLPNPGGKRVTLPWLLGLTTEKSSIVRRFVENTPWCNTRQGGAISWMKIREVLALNLRKFRRAKGLSQEELADRAKIDRTYISSIERSVYAASIDVVDRLARALDVEAADLLRQPSAPSGAGKKDRR